MVHNSHNLNLIIYAISGPAGGSIDGRKVDTLISWSMWSHYRGAHSVPKCFDGQHQL